MVINLFGSVISVSAEHPAKAYPPMLFNSVESVILLNDVQKQYLQPIITQYFIDNKSEIWLLFLIAHSKR